MPIEEQQEKVKATSKQLLELLKDVTNPKMLRDALVALHDSKSIIAAISDIFPNEDLSWINNEFDIVIKAHQDQLALLEAEGYEA